MAKFATGKRINLDFMGEGQEPNPWAGCYITIRRYSEADLEALDNLPTTERRKVKEDGKMVEKEVTISNKKAFANLREFVKERFVDGVFAAEGGDKAKVTADDFTEDFPIDVIKHVISELTSGISPN